MSNPFLNKPRKPATVNPITGAPLTTDPFGSTQGETGFEFPLNEQDDFNWNDPVGLLRQILAAVGGPISPGKPPIPVPPKVNSLTVIVVTAGTSPTKLSSVPLYCRWAIVQNISNSTTDTIAVSSSQNSKVGAILNPPGTAGQGGGSIPFAAPSPTELFDLSSVFVTGTAGTDQVAVAFI